MSLPLSVVLPVYNNERYLPAALDSVLTQTFADFELIAIDDGSPDGSLAVLRRYEAMDPRVRVISRPNTGIVGALNDGIAVSRGELIARMDADDLSLPDRFARQISFLNEHPDHVAVGCQVLLMDGDGLPICLKKDTEFTHERIDHAHLHNGWPVVHPAVMMRRSAIEAVGGYRTRFQWQEDMDLFLRLAEIGKLANLPDPLLQYRLHFDSVTWKRREEQGSLRAALYEETRRRRGMPPEEGPPERITHNTKWELHKLWAWWALAAQNLRTARKHALRAVTCGPLSPESWRVLACAVRGH
ncbi:MAG: glycosyl transferase family 2 [Phycisphaerales bacterium]|nr:glycosyl transferase family 2 [Phycisphaerales bacterium]MDB5354449.1 glycosyl transferase family 2 [Phycisphaerales bacterium]